MTTKDFQATVSVAHIEVQRTSKLMKCIGWDFAIGTSDSTKSIRDVLTAELPQKADITTQGMRHLADRIIEIGSVKKAKSESLKPERVEVFVGGLVVMMAAFNGLSLTKMTVTKAALHDGVSRDLIGRSLNVDMREQITAEFQRCYHVSLDQAKHVADTVQTSMNSLCYAKNVTVQELALWNRHLNRTGRLYEIGLDITYTGYREHSIYILENTDVPGFSCEEQTTLAQLIISHHGDLKKMADIIGSNEIIWRAVLSLCLAALFCRPHLSPDLSPQAQLCIDENSHSFILRTNAQWLEQHPLIADTLDHESTQ